MKSIITAIAITIVTLTSCSTSKLTAEQVSWQAFCKENGYALTDNSDATVNKYLDTWCGSQAEDAALAAAGINF